MTTRGRRAEPDPLGRAHVLLAADHRSYVRWTPHASSDVPDGGRLAAVAAVDFAVRATLSDAGWGRRAVGRHLERICAATSAADYGERCGVTQVLFEAPPPGTLGPSVQVDAARRADGRFALAWSVPAPCRAVSGTARTFAALWGWAAVEGQDATVHHALYALRGGYERSGPFPAAVADDLVSSLLLFGADMADTDARAAESRARLRAI